MSSNRATEAVFTATAAAYDPARAKLIPGFTEFYASAVAAMPPDTDHALDLGAGTGLLSVLVRERFPHARLHLIDNSDAMLAQAEARFARDQEVLCQLGDYTTCPWGAEYDAIVSALSIHHLPDEAKRELFERCLRGLKPGGVFINAEQILQPAPELEAAAKAEWLAEVQALGATEQQIADSLLRQAEDRCATTEEQLQWLREAGFAQVQCTYRRGRFAVFVASTPPIGSL
jgi:tRNA (cmo5U34)-methyltransferase